MKFLKLILVSLIISIPILLVIYLPHKIVVKEITCQNQYGSCNSKLNDKLQKISGHSLHSAKISVEDILSKDMLVKDYSLQFKLPADLEVYLLEKKAKYALIGKGDSRVAHVNKDGQTISLSDSTNLPLVVTEQPTPLLGDIVKDDVLFSLEILFDVYSSYKVKKANLTKNSLVIELAQGTKVIFPQEGDRQILLGSLNLILNLLNSSNRNTKIGDVNDVNIEGKTVDLRFKNPVIR
jgi:hypothetical protein